VAPAPACEPVDAARGQKAFERAQAFLDSLRTDEHPTLEAFNRGVGDLEEAAKNGSLEGQFRFGNTLVGFLFTDHAPEPADERDYVRGLTFLRVAALRGHPAVLRSYAGLEAPKLAGVRFETPLEAVPREWIAQAFERADRWMSCAPAAAKAPYVAPPAPKPRTLLDQTDSGYTLRGDPEGPLLRVGDVDETGAPSTPSVAADLLGALPELYDCYAAALGRDPDASAELTIELGLPEKKISVTGASDADLLSCVKSAALALKLPGDAERKLRLELGAYPRALSAPALGDAGDRSEVEHRELDGSCWIIETHPCAPHKMCMAPTRVRVRCPP
jgi:hypothetical protein